MEINIYIHTYTLYTYIYRKVNFSAASYDKGMIPSVKVLMIMSIYYIIFFSVILSRVKGGLYKLDLEILTI